MTQTLHPQNENSVPIAIEAIMKTIAYLYLTLIVCASALPAQPRTVEANAVQAWLGYNIAELTELTVGPEGGKIFPLWSRETGEPELEGVLVQVPVVIDLGAEVTAKFEMYFDSTGLRPKALVFDLAEPVEMSQAAAYFEAPYQVRDCRPAEDPDALETSLVPAPEGEGTLNLAVFPELRLVAELFGPGDSISALRWVAEPQPLEGCP